MRFISTAFLASSRHSQQQQKGNALRMSASKEMIPEAVSWCVAHGAVYALPIKDAEMLGEEYEAGGAFAHAPFALNPFEWPKAEYDKVVALQPALSLAIDSVSRDAEWLEKTLGETVASDEFTRRVWKLYQDYPNPQSLTLGLLRSDYMLDEPNGDKRQKRETRSLQVEINTIASSFACLSETISSLHSYLAAKQGVDQQLSNEAGRGLAAGIAEAHLAYLDQQQSAESSSARRAVATTVMVVQPGERNQMDQRKLEHFLWDRHSVPMVRLTLQDIEDRGIVQGDTKILSVDDMEVSVVYFRAGYSPDDYSSEDQWSARAKIERSMAIKCPSAAYQLAGTKKVQQALAAPGALERFTNDAETANEIRTVFAGLFDLDEAAAADADKAVASALADPSKFVLKPQREGGGNNLYGDEIKEALERMTPKERSAYILMERIVSQPRFGTLVRNGVPITGDCVAELGIYSAILKNEREVLLNSVCGHLLRQKLLGVDEGGVAAGFAVLSSPNLV